MVSFKATSEEGTDMSAKQILIIVYEKTILETDSIWITIAEAYKLRSIILSNGHIFLSKDKS